MHNNTLKLISGAYTSVLWETLEDVFLDEDSPTHIYDVLKALHDWDMDKEAFEFVRILYDFAGLMTTLYPLSIAEL
jgi:hypothetical protein